MPKVSGASLLALSQPLRNGCVILMRALAVADFPVRQALGGGGLRQACG